MISKRYSGTKSCRDLAEKVLEFILNEVGNHVSVLFKGQCDWMYILLKATMWTGIIEESKLVVQKLHNSPGIDHGLEHGNGNEDGKQIN